MPSNSNQGVSIITCSRRPQFFKNILQNFKNQTWINKELIIILNDDHTDLVTFKERIKNVNNVSIYQLPEKVSLGKCLNFAIKKVKYPFIAKFDDDDYYGSSYLSDSMKAFQRSNADIVGKTSHFTYLQENKLLLYYAPNQENKFVKFVSGATIMVRKSVFDSVQFSDLSLGEDVKFLRDCHKKGFKIYSGNRFHFVYIRRKNNHHTWKTSYNYLLSRSKIIAVTNNYKTWASKNQKKPVLTRLNRNS